MATQLYVLLDDNNVVIETWNIPDGSTPPPAPWMNATGMANAVIGATWNGTTFAAPVVPPAVQAQAALSAGLTVTSTSTPALNGTYACDHAAQFEVLVETSSLQLNHTFSTGQTTIGWPDTAGVSHTATIANFEALATVLWAYYRELTDILATNTGTLPPSSVTIG